jgi:hypothetical protein
MDDLSRLCCQNPACPEYGVRDGGNLSVCDRATANKTNTASFTAMSARSDFPNARVPPSSERICPPRRWPRSWNI